MQYSSWDFVVRLFVHLTEVCLFFCFDFLTCSTSETHRSEDSLACKKFSFSNFQTFPSAGPFGHQAKLGVTSEK